MRFMTLKDLYNYFEKENKNINFSAKNDENKSIVVQIPGKVKFEKTDDTSTIGLLPVTL